MKAIVCGLFLLCGCGYSTSQTRLVSSPAGVRMSESRNCVGLDCGNSYGYGAGYSAHWAAGPAFYQGLAPSWGRLGMIEAYRAQNQWVRSPGDYPSGGARDPRLDRLAPHLRRMANAMCGSGVLTGDDCIPPERLRQREQHAAQAPAATPSAANQQSDEAPNATHLQSSETDNTQGERE